MMSMRLEGRQATCPQREGSPSLGSRLGALERSTCAVPLCTLVVVVVVVRAVRHLEPLYLLFWTILKI